jgi:hypothetical protein
MSEWIDTQMLDEKDRVDIEKEMRLLWFMWAGDVGVPVAVVSICYLMAEQIRENIHPKEGFPLGVLEVILAVVGLFLLALAYFLRKALRRGKLNLYEKTSMQEAATRNKPGYLLKYRMNVLVPMMIPPSLGLFGFMLFMLGAGYETLCAFAIVSALGVLWQRPRKKELIDFFHREKAKEAG